MSDATVADVLLRHADSDAPAMSFGDETWTYRDLVTEGLRRGQLFDEMRDRGRPPHIGLLLDNGPEYVFWLAAAALTGSVAVGVNSTYRGDQLGLLVRHTDCAVLVTDADHRKLVVGVDVGIAKDRMLVTDEPGYGTRLADQPVVAHSAGIDEDALFLLIFTSGSTGLPKAVRCTQGRHTRTGAHVASIANLTANDVVYAPLPLFHTSALFTGWAAAINAGATFTSRPRFSASNTLADLRRHGATFMAYTGKVLNYILATAEAPDDADNPLRLAIGNEASARDIKEFARRFSCDVRDSYGSTEGVIIIRRDPSMPETALGMANPTVLVIDPTSGKECPPVEFSPQGAPINLDVAIGEIVETAPSRSFEGYYQNAAASNERFRDGQYWSGDLAYRDANGWLYFAGRSNDWLRVDGENFAAAPVEAIVARHPDVRAVAVYAVPDDPVGDRVMVALELSDPRHFDPAEFDDFLSRQPDLGTKWRPSFVRTTSELPKLASMKTDKMRLRREAWNADTVYWRPGRDQSLRLLDVHDRDALAPLLVNR